MSSTDILTFDQGIILFIESGLFLVFYSIYHIFFGQGMHFTNIIATFIFFSLWLIVVTVSSNIALSLNVPISRSSSIPFQDKGINWKKY